MFVLKGNSGGKPYPGTKQNSNSQPFVVIDKLLMCENIFSLFSAHHHVLSILMRVVIDNREVVIIKLWKWFLHDISETMIWETQSSESIKNSIQVELEIQEFSVVILGFCPSRLFHHSTLCKNDICKLKNTGLQKNTVTMQNCIKHARKALITCITMSRPVIATKNVPRHIKSNKFITWILLTDRTALLNICFDNYIILDQDKVMIRQRNLMILDVKN